MDGITELASRKAGGVSMVDYIFLIIVVGLGSFGSYFQGRARGYLSEEGIKIFDRIYWHSIIMRKKYYNQEGWRMAVRGRWLVVIAVSIGWIYLFLIRTRISN